MNKGLFRAGFPEFADTARYSDVQLDFWSAIAELQINSCLWGTMFATGVYLYVAHEITLAAQNKAAGAIGGNPGGQSGPVNTKTVGSVSVGYDTAVASEKDAGYWNLTAYGKKFIHLARMFGAGPIQL